MKKPLLIILIGAIALVVALLSIRLNSTYSVHDRLKHLFLPTGFHEQCEVEHHEWGNPLESGLGLAAMTCNCGEEASVVAEKIASHLTDGLGFKRRKSDPYADYFKNSMYFRHMFFREDREAFEEYMQGFDFYERSGGGWASGTGNDPPAFLIMRDTGSTIEIYARVADSEFE